MSGRQRRRAAWWRMAGGLLASAFVLAGVTVTADDASRENGAKDVPEWVTQREREFARRYSGVALVGRFSIVDDRGQTKKTGEPERYEILEVSPLPTRNLWLFRARIQYGGGNPVVLPIPLRVLWAGNTPVITLDEQAIPGLGTFSARVMLHGTRYAGTWQHGKTGGHMWGAILPLPSPSESSPEKTSRDD